MLQRFVALIVFTCLSGCVLPPTGMASPTFSANSLIFQDDFSSVVSGWDRVQYDAGTMDYDGGAYRILVNALQTNFWSTAHKDLRDVRIEVDAGRFGGPDENRLGLICRSNGTAFYFFMISSDGYYGLGMYNEPSISLIGQTAMKPSEAIHRGSAVNHLRFDCNETKLSAFVNGAQVAEAADQLLIHGDVGLIAGTFDQPGVDIVFDNFMVTAP